MKKPKFRHKKARIGVDAWQRVNNPRVFHLFIAIRVRWEVLPIAVSMLSAYDITRQAPLMCVVAGKPYMTLRLATFPT